jgi:hypothetical protein
VKATLKASQMQLAVRRRTLDQRAIDRLIQTQNFREAWEQASQVQRSLLVQLISNSSIEEVREWFKSVYTKKIVDLSYRELRVLGQRARIPYYSRMQKEDLIAALLKKKEAEHAE